MCGSGNFGSDILCGALRFTGLDESLSDNDGSSWTLFAPNDDAFKKLLSSSTGNTVFQAFMDSEYDEDYKVEHYMDKLPETLLNHHDALKEILLYHTVTDKKMKFADLDCDGKLRMSTKEMSYT